MQRNRLYSLPILFIVAFIFSSWTIREKDFVSNNAISFFSVYTPAPDSKKAMETVYDSLNLNDRGLSHDAFETAIDGFSRLQERGMLQNDSVLTIIDFDQPSYKKRLFIIDMKNFRLLFNTLVAHGKNTGKEIAEYFSNVPESNKSSLGFYMTSDTYFGSKGFSLKLIGLEKRLNSNALERAIVLHGASYVSESYINTQGYIGRSHGCPAVPMEYTRPIIQTIKNGSCLFIYNKSYKNVGSLQGG